MAMREPKKTDTKILRKLAESEDIDQEIERQRKRCRDNMSKIRARISAVAAEMPSTPLDKEN